MFDGIGFPWWSRPFLPILEPDYVAGEILEAIVRDRPLVIMPCVLRWLPFALRALLPVSWLDWCANTLGATTAMSSFVGHANDRGRRSRSRVGERGRSPSPGM